MTQYLYPQNLTAKTNFLLWSIKDFIILCIVALLSIVLFATLNLFLPLALTLCFAVLTIRREDVTMIDFIVYAVKFFLTEQQYYEWR